MRRRALLGMGLAIVANAATRQSVAMGRVPVGGTASVRVPHDTAQIDPHDLTDPMAALVGASVFEPVFRLDAQGNPYPSLAERLPVRDGVHTVVTLREGLRSSRGKALDARDLVFSIDRVRGRGAAALLGAVPKPTVARSNPRSVVFRGMDPEQLARLMASPILALIARGSSPTEPDGTGAFRADPSPDALVLTRNRQAARGASFLDKVTLYRASSLSEPLRAFEANEVDIGWLGAGYHQQRADAVAFDFGLAAWIVLRTGTEAGAWHAAGVAQRLLDGIPPARLAHLALGNLPAESGAMLWGGEPCQLVVGARSPHLVEVANAIAAILSAPGHEITPFPVAEAELERRRRAGAFGLMIDVVRPVGPAGVATLIALAAADDPERAKSIVRAPPRLGSFAPRVLARTLGLGVLGELRIAGAAIRGLRLAPLGDGYGWDLGGAYRVGA